MVNVTPAPELRHRLPDRLDWYTLRSLFGPLLLCLCVLLLALLLGRLLRLFDMAAATGASTWLVLKMAASLVPHYLGMAVPVAFFAAIFIAVARSGDDNELDAMLATGRSITRMAAPYFLVAVALCGFNVYLFGYLKPLTRYGYELNVHEARQTGWNGRMVSNRFVTVKQGFTLGADSVGADGRELGGVFVERRDDLADTEEIITAERGRLVPSADGRRLLLELENGMIVRDYPDRTVRTVRFEAGRINQDFTAVPPPFRARGDADNSSEAVRELTVPELWASGIARLHNAVTAAGAAGEFHGRVAWTLLPLLLPLLALPLGMAAKRGRRAPGNRVCNAGIAGAVRGIAVRREPGRSWQGTGMAGCVAARAGVRCVGPVAVPQQPAMAGRQPRHAFGQCHRSSVRRPAAQEEGSVEMKRVLGSYLRGRIAGQIFGLLLALTALMQLLELLEVTPAVLERKLGVMGLLHYAALRLPGEMLLMLPLAGLLGSMSAFYAMARTREITALRTAGVGLGRLLLYLLPVPFLFALLQFGLSQYVVPAAESSLRTWWESTTPLESKPADPQWVQTRNDILLFERSSADGRKLLDVRIYERDQQGLLALRTRASRAEWDGSGWQLADARDMHVEPGAVPASKALQAWDSNLRPEDVVQLDVPDPHLSSMALADVIGGERVSTRPRSFYLTVLLQSFTAPFAVFIMMLLAMRQQSCRSAAAVGCACCWRWDLAWALCWWMAFSPRSEPAGGFPL